MQPHEVVDGYRATCEVALDGVAIHLLEERERLLVLDSFGDHFEAQAVRQADDRRPEEHQRLNGHAAGDAALKSVVGALRSSLRSFDPILRYGGDEFVAGMGGIELADAERRFQLIKETLQGELGIRISVGMAALAMGETVDELIARADSTLLRRRRNERDGTPVG